MGISKISLQFCISSEILSSTSNENLCLADQASRFINETIVALKAHKSQMLIFFSLSFLLFRNQSLC